MLEYFLGVQRFRYTKAPFIPKAGQFARFDDKRVLEIGCGLGTDGAQFAQAGAHYIGVDLTEAAIERARENFAARGLCGEFLAADVEMLPLPSDSFDHVYSFGLIHYSPNPAAIVAEVRRVLRPGGTVTVMLYNRTEAKTFFPNFEDVRTEICLFHRSHWPFVGRLISDRLADAIGKRLGWNRMVYTRKPRS